MTQAAALADAVHAEDDAAWSRGRLGTERLRAGDIDGAAADLAQARAEGESRRSPTLTALADPGLADVARARGKIPYTDLPQRSWHTCLHCGPCPALIEG